MTTPTTKRLLTWRPRMTIRARLTLTYAGLLTVAGAIMLILVYSFMRFVPTYAIASTASVSASPQEEIGVLPIGTAPPTVRGTGSVRASLELTSANDILNTLLLVSALVLVLLAVVGSVVGWIIAGRVLRPLQAINDAAHLASTGALDHRVGLTGPHDEVRDLSDTFDDMLDTLERSFQAQKRFTANASHELRTPIATVQTLLDVALADPNLTLRQLRTTADRVRATNLRSAKTIEALLDLASIEYRTSRRDPVDLARIAFEVMQDEVVHARARDITFTEALEPVVVIGNPVLIRQAVQNLVQNAVRHNVRGGTVRIVTEAEGDEHGVVIVSNTGPVVPAAQISSLAEPFVRGAGRVDVRGTAEGSGLGLAIVETVAESHHGEMRLSANDSGGLTATLALPVASTQGSTES